MIASYQLELVAISRLLIHGERCKVFVERKEACFRLFFLVGPCDRTTGGKIRSSSPSVKSGQSIYNLDAVKDWNIGDYYHSNKSTEVTTLWNCSYGS